MPIITERKSRRILPEKPRERDLIHDDIRSTMKKLVNGALAWPWYLWGPPRVGKTCAALCLLDFASGRYWTADQWAADLNEARESGLEEVIPGAERVIKTPGHYVEKFGYPPERLVKLPDRVTILKPHHLWRRVAESVLFVLDDVAMRACASEHQRLSVKRILDDRAGRPLICISNERPEELEARYGLATARRLTEGTITRYGERKI